MGKNKEQRKTAKRLSNIKMVVCLGAALALGIGFLTSGINTTDKSGKFLAIRREEADSSTQAEPVDESYSVPYKPAAVPELTCAGIVFEDGSVLFADQEGGYSLLDADRAIADSITVTDDSKNKITLDCSKGVSFTDESGDKEKFLYNGHTIELKSGLVYYDSSLVQYNDKAFSAYKLSDDYTLECTNRGHYVLRKKDGTVTDKGTVTDDNGIKVTVHATDNGFEAIDEMGYIELALKFNGDLVVTSYYTLQVYINGEELVPPGFDDLYVKPKAPPVESSETDSSEEDSNDSSSKPEPPPYSNVSKTPLVPTLPPKEYGYVNKGNAELSSYTMTMLGYINDVRRQYGLKEIYGLAMIDEVARTRARELEQSFSHERPDGTSYTTALDEAGIAWWSCKENIAKTGSDSCEEVLNMWMESEGHRANILSPDMKYMAVYCVKRADGEYYWDMMLMYDIYVRE